VIVREISARSIEAAIASRTRTSSSGGCCVCSARPTTSASGTVRNCSPGAAPSDARCDGESRFQSSAPLRSRVKFVPGSGTTSTSSRAIAGRPRQ